MKEAAAAEKEGVFIIAGGRFASSVRRKSIISIGRM
jgi:hypothetical protein